MYASAPGGVRSGIGPATMSKRPRRHIHRRANRRPHRAAQGTGSAPAGVRIADPRQKLTLVIDDADPRPEIWRVAVHRHPRAKFADIADRMVGIGHVEPARAVQIVPLGLVFAVAVKYL